MSDDFNIDDIKLVKRTAPASPESASHNQTSIPDPEIKEELEVTLTRRQLPQTPPAPDVVPKTVPPPAPPPAPAASVPPPPPEIKIPAKKAPQINIPGNTQLKRPDAIEKKGNADPVFDVPEMDITVKAAPPPPPPVHGKAVPPKPAKGKSLLPGERSAASAGKPKTSEIHVRNYGRGCCIFAFVVPLIFGAGIAATIRYWKPLRSQLAKFEAWMVDKGLAFDGGDAPWKHQSKNKELPPETNSDSQ